MKLLPELEHYKSLSIEKNCKEEIIRFISLLCLFQCLHVQQITTCFNFVWTNSLSLNLQGMVNNIKTIVFWKLVCIFCYIVAKKISSKAEEFLQNKQSKAHVIRFPGAVRKLNVHEMRKLRQKRYQFFFLKDHAIFWEK